MGQMFVVITADRPGAGKTTAARLIAEIAIARGLSCVIESDHAIPEQLWLLGDPRFSSHWKDRVWGFNCSSAALRDALGMLVDEQLEREEQIIGVEFVHGRRGVRDALQILDPVLTAGQPIFILYVKASLELSRAQERSRIEAGGQATAEDAHYKRVYGCESLELSSTSSHASIHRRNTLSRVPQPRVADGDGPSAPAPVDAGPGSLLTFF